ncbi:MAG: hypothetical protein RL260_1923 [Pseudomonadota bacterium]|jgi:hypothetical protein
MDTLKITKPQLEAALLRWEQVAAESADHLWQELGATVSA